MSYRQAPWKNDPRSRKFSHHRFFGAASPEAIKALYDRPLGPVLNQKYSLRCTGYGSAANGWYIHGVKMHPDWQADQISEIQGRSVDINGGDPNAAMKSERDRGFLAFDEAPHLTLESNTLENTRNFPPSLKEKAKKFDNIPGFVRVDGPKDIYSNIIDALALAYNPETRRGAVVQAFGTWYHDWTPRDLIPAQYTNFAGYHAYVFVKPCPHHTDCLIAQNSYGTEAGDNGFHHFPREVVNREFSKWGTSLKIVKTLTEAQLEEAKKDTPLGNAWAAFVNLLYLVSETFGRFAGTTVESKLMQLVQLLQRLYDALKREKQVIEPLPAPTPAPDLIRTPEPVLSPSDRLLDAAVKAIGKDLSRLAPDERGCAESLSMVIQEVDPSFPTFLSTAKMAHYLKNTQDFEIVSTPKPGDIAIFPTRGSAIGHCGIVGHKYIMSNNSVTGRWDPNYTLAGWKAAATRRGLTNYFIRMH